MAMDHAALLEVLDTLKADDGGKRVRVAAAPAFVTAAPADGRTLLINTSAHAYSAALTTGLPYDAIADFVAIAPVMSQPYVLVASGRSGIRGLDELISAAQVRPLTFVSAGAGTGTHFSVAS
jgi:tripartite-type tricarboxylate transporter receptor subunit TctC